MEAAVQGSTPAIRHEFNSRHVMMNKWCILTDLWCMTQFCQRATQFLKNVCRNFRHFWNPLSPALSWQGGRRVGACEKPKLANNWCCNHCNAGRPGLRVVGFERHFALGDNVDRVVGAEKMLQSSIWLLPMQCLMKETTVSKENRSSEIINVFSISLETSFGKISVNLIGSGHNFLASLSRPINLILKKEISFWIREHPSRDKYCHIRNINCCDVAPGDLNDDDDGACDWESVSCKLGHMSALMATWLTGGVTHRHHHRQHHRNHRSHHQCHHRSHHQRHRRRHHHHHYLGPYLTIFVCRIISGLYEKSANCATYVIVLIFGGGANFRRFSAKFGHLCIFANSTRLRRIFCAIGKNALLFILFTCIYNSEKWLSKLNP